MKAKAAAASQQNAFLRIITIPFRALAKARDAYVRSMINCGDRVGRGSSFAGMPASNYAVSLPRSFSVNSSISDDNDDLRELIRAASTRSLSDRIGVNNLSSLVNGPKAMPPRSCSVGMGRIDEEKPAVFGEDQMNLKKHEVMYPRSKSHAVNRRKFLF